MTTPARGSRTTLDLDREEAWVLHAGLLEHLQREAEDGNPAPVAVALLTALESETNPVLGGEELRLVRSVLVEYMADAPLRDRAICRGVLAELRRVLG